MEPGLLVLRHVSKGWEQNHCPRLGYGIIDKVCFGEGEYVEEVSRDAVGLLACIESNENSVFDVADQLGPTEVFPFTKDDTSAISDL